MSPRSRFAYLAIATLTTSLLSAGCGGLGKELAGSFALGALEGFNHRVLDEGDEWEEAWRSRGVGVGVTARSEAAARTVDCSGVSDEFDELYRGEVLRSPRLYVATLDGRLTRHDFERLPRGDFRLTGSRAGGAIAVVKTTSGNHAKLVVHFDKGADGSTRARLQDVTVVDEAGAILRDEPGPIDLEPRVTLDLDPRVSASADGFDLLYGEDATGAVALLARDGAALSFPTRSLCAPAEAVAGVAPRGLFCSARQAGMDDYDVQEFRRLMPGADLGCPDAMEIVIDDRDAAMDRRVSMGDAEFYDHYIDFNIVEANAYPDENLEPLVVLQRLDVFDVMYANGQVLSFRLDEVQVLESWPPMPGGPYIRSSAHFPVADTEFEKVDGFIYPKTHFFTWDEAPNLVMMRTRLQQIIDAKQIRLELAVAVQAFVDIIGIYKQRMEIMGPSNDVKFLREVDNGLMRKE